MYSGRGFGFYVSEDKWVTTCGNLVQRKGYSMVATVEKDEREENCNLGKIEKA